MHFERLLRAAISRGRFPEAEDRVEEWVAARLSRHRQASGSFEQRTPEGRWLQVLEQRTPDGGIILLATDITEVKTREEVLRLLASAEPDETGFFAAVARSLQAALGYRWTGISSTVEGGERSRILAWVEGDR